jgi:hypothetical protein
MKLTKRLLTKLIEDERREVAAEAALREEVRRHIKLVLEAPSMDDLVAGLGKEKVKDFDSLKDVIEKFVDAGGDKGVFKDKEGLDKLKAAYKDQGGKETEVDTVAKEIVSGKMQVSGDVAGAAKAAANALGSEEIAGQLAQVVTKLKGGTDVGQLSTSQKEPLAQLGAKLVFGDRQQTVNAAKALSKVGQKK